MPIQPEPHTAEQLAHVRRAIDEMAKHAAGTRAKEIAAGHIDDNANFDHLHAFLRERINKIESGESNYHLEIANAVELISLLVASANFRGDLKDRMATILRYSAQAMAQLSGQLVAYIGMFFADAMSTEAKKKMN